ncbi:hypothetical protein ACHAXT_003654 [Thalassiosira profunda]
MARTPRRAPGGDGEGDDLSTTTGHSVTFIGDVYEEDYPREAVGGAPQHLGRSGERPAAIAGRQGGRRADAETVNDSEDAGPYEGAKGREDVSVQGDAPRQTGRQTGSISRYDATIANSISGRECVASDGVSGNGDISQPAIGGGVEVVDDGDAPVPFHHRGTGSNAPAPQPNGRPEIIQEDGPPMHHSEIEAAADDKSKPAKERGVELIEDEEPAPNYHPSNNAGDEVANGRTAGKDPMDNAYLFMRYLLWVLTGIPPPSEEAVSSSEALSADEDRRPAAIPARSTQQSPEEDTTGSSMQPQHHVLEARLVDEETPEFLVTYAYQPTQPTDTTTSTPVYDAYPVNEGDDESESKEGDETAPIPCWKRYERSACFVRALLLCVLAVSLAVGLTVNRQTPDSELEQVKQNPQSPTNPDARNVMACVCSLAQDGYNGSQLQLESTHRCQDDDSLAYEQAQRAPPFSMCVYPSADDAAAGFDIEEVSLQHIESNTLWDANLTTSVSIDESYLVTEEDSGNATVKTMVLTPLPPVTEIFSTISTPDSFGGTLEVAGEVSFDVEQGVIPAPQARQLMPAESATFQLLIDLLPSSPSNPGNGPTKTPSLQPVAADPTTSPAFPSLTPQPPSMSPSSSPVEDDSKDGDSDPHCANTIGFVDIYGDGCGYYEADANYPLFCASYGANGPAGNTPNEHCCVCKEALEAKGPTGDVPPTMLPTKGPSSKPTAPQTPSPSSEPSAQPTKQFILLGGTTSPSARPTGEPSNRPTDQPTKTPSSEPTARPSARPTGEPSDVPTKAPSGKPTEPIAPSPTLPGQPTSFPSARPTSKPTEQPTKSPSSKPTSPPTRNPTREPSDQPTNEPSSKPTVSPSARPTSKPTDQPTKQPIDANPPTSPSQKPTDVATPAPSKKPTIIPTQSPSPAPTQKPTMSPTRAPSKKPTDIPTRIPSKKPTDIPTRSPSPAPTPKPSGSPTLAPSKKPTAIPTQSPSPAPTKRPTDSPTRKPTQKPTDNPTFAPSKKPTAIPTAKPTQQPTKQPTKQPTNEPTADPLQQLVFDETIVAQLSNENVAISGDTAVVGAYNNGIDGKAFVFGKVNGVWVQQQTLEDPLGGSADTFGRSVDIDGDYIVVGAHGDNANSGVAHVFFRSGDSWSWQQKLIPPGDFAVLDDFFGYSVAISGSSIIVGAYGRTSTNTGAAYVFDEGGGPDQWSRTGILLHPTLQSGASFGRSVDIDGDYAIVGAYRDVINGPSSGSAHVFVRNAGIWTHQDTLEDQMGAANDLFGSIVSIHEGRAVVGAHLSDEDGQMDAGSSHVFNRSGDVWNYQADLADNFFFGANDFFGYSVAVHGSQLVVGAPFSIGGGQSGSVHRFIEGSGGGSGFSPIQILTAPDKPLFGMSVAVDSGTVIIGSQDSAYVLSSFAAVEAQLLQPPGPGAKMATGASARFTARDAVADAGGEEQDPSATAHSMMFIGDIDEEDYSEILSRARASDSGAVGGGNAATGAAQEPSGGEEKYD